MPVIVVRYEDLVADTRTELQRMLDFLNCPCTKERMDCVMDHQIETFHRKHQQNFDPFTKQQKEQLIKTMKQVEPLFNLHNASYRDFIDA